MKGQGTSDKSELSQSGEASDELSEGASILKTEEQRSDHSPSTE